MPSRREILIDSCVCGHAASAVMQAPALSSKREEHHSREPTKKALQRLVMTAVMPTTAIRMKKP